MGITLIIVSALLAIDLGLSLYSSSFIGIIPVLIRVTAIGVVAYVGIKFMRRKVAL